MSNPFDPIDLETPRAGRRRRYTPEQKRQLLDEAARSGNSISTTARRYGVAPSLLFHWKRVMDDASKKGLKANEAVVPESEVKALRAKIRELERQLGRKTMEAEILKEALEIAREKKLLSHGSSSDEDGGQ
jgi:transposase